MFIPTKLPCTAWYVNDVGVHEVTLTAWYGRENYCFLCFGKTKRRVIPAIDCHPTKQAAVKSAIQKLELEKSRLKSMLEKCEIRLAHAVELEATL